MKERNQWVLLVEDNEDDVVLLERALFKVGLVPRLVIARDGVEALDILQGAPPESDRALARWPSLVMLDINLPRLSGLEVLEQMRAGDGMRMLRVVMLTTSDDASDIRRAYAAGANSFVRKPLSFEEFKETVGYIGRYWVDLNQQPTKPIS